MRMTRTPPEDRRRLTGGAVQPQKGILRRTPEGGRTPPCMSMFPEVWPAKPIARPRACTSHARQRAETGGNSPWVCGDCLKSGCCHIRVQRAQFLIQLPYWMVVARTVLSLMLTHAREYAHTSPMRLQQKHRWAVVGQGGTLAVKIGLLLESLASKCKCSEETTESQNSRRRLLHTQRHAQLPPSSWKCRKKLKQAGNMDCSTQLWKLQAKSPHCDVGTTAKDACSSPRHLLDPDAAQDRDLPGERHPSLPHRK